MKMNESKNALKTAICYYRSTSEVQNRATVAQQREAAEKYAIEHGMTIIGEYSDVGGAASLDGRPGIQSLLCELKYKDADCILIWKANRISRDAFEQMFFQKIAKKAGYEIIYTAESNKNDADDGVIMKAFMSGLAEKYEKMANMAVAYEEEKY